MSPRTTGSPPPRRYPPPPCSRSVSTTADGAPPPEQPTQSSGSSLTLNPVKTLTKVRDIPADRRNRIRHRQVRALRVLPQLFKSGVGRLRVTRDHVPRPGELEPDVLGVRIVRPHIHLEALVHDRFKFALSRHAEPISLRWHESVAHAQCAVVAFTPVCEPVESAVDGPGDAIQVAGIRHRVDVGAGHDPVPGRGQEPP